MGKGYIYSPAHLPGHNAVWFCNTLNFHGDYGNFDDSYYKDELFNPIFDSLKINFSKDINGADVISFFACHPTKVRAEQFWDFNFYEGANPDTSELKAPALRPADSMITARKNFRRLMQFLKSQDNIEVTTFSDLMDRFSYQHDFINKKDLRNIATEIVEGKTIQIGEYFSPAEVFAALVQSITECTQGKKIPKKLKRISPLGPMEMPPEIPEISNVSISQINEMASTAYSTIIDRGCLPSSLCIEDKCIGTGSLLALFSSVFLDIVSDNQKDSYEVIAFDPYPKENEDAIISEVEGYKDWIVHRTDLDMAHLVQLTKLQLWTLKPAHEQD
ncbi:hypothetical protein ES705_30432 [subsurface metagenome]